MATYRWSHDSVDWKGVCSHSALLDFMVNSIRRDKYGYEFFRKWHANTVESRKEVVKERAREYRALLRSTEEGRARLKAAFRAVLEWRHERLRALPKEKLKVYRSSQSLYNYQYRQRRHETETKEERAARQEADRVKSRNYRARQRAEGTAFKERVAEHNRRFRAENPEYRQQWRKQRVENGQEAQHSTGWRERRAAAGLDDSDYIENRHKRQKTPPAVRAPVLPGRSHRYPETGLWRSAPEDQDPKYWNHW